MELASRKYLSRKTGMPFETNIQKLLNKGAKLIKGKDDTLILELFQTEDYSIAYGELLQGTENKLHRLEMDEIYYFMEGDGILSIDEHEVAVTRESIVIVPKLAAQKLKNTGGTKLRFIMKVIPPFSEEKEVILE